MSFAAPKMLYDRVGELGGQVSHMSGFPSEMWPRRRAICPRQGPQKSDRIATIPAALPTGPPEFEDKVTGTLAFQPLQSPTGVSSNPTAIF